MEFFPIFSAVFSVPAAAGGAAAGKRRHSYQSGVPGLAKDMDRLRVSAAAANAGGNQGQGRSPRGSTRRRASSARRSSRSGNQIPNFSPQWSHNDRNEFTSIPYFC